MTTVTIEAAQGQLLGDPFDSLVWTDLTARCRSGVEFERGRIVDGEGGGGGLGSFTMEVNSGPTGLAVRTPVRVLADDSPLFTGFVTDLVWKQSGTDDFTVKVTMTDVLGRLANRPVRGGFFDAIRASDPNLYWPMGDEADLQEVRSGLPGGLSLVPVDWPDYTVEEQAPDGRWFLGVESDLDGRPVLALSPGGLDAGSKTKFLKRDNVGVDASQAFLTIGLYALSTRLSGVQRLATFTGAAGQPFLQWEMEPYSNQTGAVHRIKHKGGTTSFGVVGDPKKWRSYLLESGPSGLRMWAGGVEAPGDVDGSPMTSHAGFTSTAIGHHWSGQLAHYAAWASATSQAQELVRVMNDDWNNTPADQRWEYLGLMGRVGSWTEKPTGSTFRQVSRQNLSEGKLLDLFEQVATVQRGFIVGTSEGKIRLDTRTGTDPVMTISATSEVAEIDGLFVESDVDSWDRAVVTMQPTNKKQVVTRTGVTNPVEDATLDLYTNDDTWAQSVAYEIANASTEPRMPSLTINIPALSSAQLTQVLALELGDVVEVVNLPTTLPASTTKLRIESIRHRIINPDWRVRLDTSPVIS